jgi:hypothetical protein
MEGDEMKIKEWLKKNGFKETESNYFRRSFKYVSKKYTVDMIGIKKYNATNYQLRDENTYLIKESTNFAKDIKPLIEQPEKLW